MSERMKTRILPTKNIFYEFGLPIFSVSLISIGIIVSLFTIGATTENGVNGTISGNVLIGVGVLLLIITLYSGIFNKRNDQSLLINNTQLTFSSLYTMGPFFIILGIIGYLLFLLFNYKSRIIGNQVSTGYNSFSITICVLLITQFLIFYSASFSEDFKNTNKISNLSSSLLYLIGVINIFAIVTLGIILKFYSTDG